MFAFLTLLFFSSQPVFFLFFFVAFSSFPPRPTYRALSQSSGGLLDVADSGQVQSRQSSGDVAADSDSVLTLIFIHSYRLPGLLILEKGEEKDK